MFWFYAPYIKILKKAIEIAKKICKDLSLESSPLLEDYNLRTPFDEIFYLNLSTEITNTLICAIIYSYDSDSNWTDLKKTSTEDKLSILKGLRADMNEKIFTEFIELSNDNINNSIGDFLDIQPDWRFSHIMKCRDYHSKALKEEIPAFTGIDDDKTAKAKETIGKLLREALTQRKIADDFIKEIERDYVKLNHRTEQDFSIKFTEAETQIDILSWRDYIRTHKPFKQLKSSLS